MTFAAKKNARTRDTLNQKLGSEVMPRLLTRMQAAAYCGVSTPTFVTHCPVKPVSLGPGKRLERFDVCALDLWIESLANPGIDQPVDWLHRMDET